MGDAEAISRCLPRGNVSGGVHPGEPISDLDLMDARLLQDLIGSDRARPELLYRPASTAEVASILKEANAKRVPVTLVGGNTGVVRGAYCEGGILISLDRLDAIEVVDPVGMTMTVQAGAILERVQKAAEDVGAFFAVDLNSRGSATIGGMIATNAGGNRVFRYGMMRESVLGLEVVLPDGEIVTDLKAVLKDNAGYNWKQLLIGSEGTLGVVTRAVLRLRPAAATAQTALVALSDARQAIDVLRRLEARLAGALTSVELMWRNYYALAIDVLLDGRPPPLSPGHPIYAIIEMLGGDPDHDSERLETVLAELLEAGALLDVAIAKSERERNEIWSLRENGSEVFRGKRPTVSSDVSVPVSAIPAFADKILDLARDQGGEAFLLGHAGDGNLHAVLAGFDANGRTAAERALYDLTASFNGSIAAEHGIGLKRRDYLHLTRSPPEIALMRTLRRAIDPNQILNPGKLF